MSKVYVIIERGVSIAAITAVMSDRERAIEVAKTLAFNDRDAYHTHEVMEVELDLDVWPKKRPLIYPDAGEIVFETRKPDRPS